MINDGVLKELPLRLSPIHVIKFSDSFMILMQISLVNIILN